MRCDFVDQPAIPRLVGAQDRNSQLLRFGALLKQHVRELLLQLQALFHSFTHQSKEFHRLARLHTRQSSTHHVQQSRTFPRDNNVLFKCGHRFVELKTGCCVMQRRIVSTAFQTGAKARDLHPGASDNLLANEFLKARVGNVDEDFCFHIVSIFHLLGPLRKTIERRAGLPRA